MGDGVDQQSRSHRLHWFAGRVHQVLDELGSPPVWSMTALERRETITELLAFEARIRAHLLAVLAEVDHAGDATSQGATHTAAWLRGLTRVTGAEAARLVRDAAGSRCSYAEDLASTE